MRLKSILNKVLLPVVAIFLFASTASAAAPDGAGPWADTASPPSQGLTNEGNPVSATRSHPDQTLGVAEQTDVDGTFFSLGFGGSITLRFVNGIANGVFVVESTRTEPDYPFYPEETAQVEISEDGSPGSWHFAGNVSQDGAVSQPEEVECAQYVKITDTSILGNFTDYPGADGYDVDGVEAQEGEPCDLPVSPTPTLEPTPEPTPTDEPSSPGPPVCGASTPNAPFLVSATAISGNQVELVWQKVDDATHYSIFYGPSSGNYLYGVPNTGDTDNFTIGGMSGGCYIVQAVNDCAPSEASNEICIGQVAGQVLGLSTTSGEKDTSPALFWAGILALLTGAKVLTRELEKKNL